MTTIKNNLISFFRSTKVKLFATILTTIYICALLCWRDRYTLPIDPEPVILELTQKEKSKASLINVGLHINGFLDFSITKNLFTIDGIIWFLFPIGAETIKTIEGFNFRNSVRGSGIDTLHYQSKPSIKILDRFVLASYHVQFTIKSHMIYKNFPLEGHKLSIILENKGVTPQELYFETNPKNLTINENTFLVNNIVREISVKAGYNKAVFNNDNPRMELSYPIVMFSMNFENIGLRDMVSLYFPMFILFFIALFCLLIDVTDISRLSYVATSVPILVLFRMVIDTISPDVGYATHVDFVYYVLVFLSLIILFFQTFVVLALQHTKRNDAIDIDLTKSQLHDLNDITFMIILILLCALITYGCLR